MRIKFPFRNSLDRKTNKKNLYHINYRALFLLLIFLFENTYPLLALSSNNKMISSSQASNGGPVADAALDMVDLFTGDFNYSVPLITVPGPNGENIKVAASYHAGIGVDQRAGILGLGWSLNVGEITREVVGIPDDFAGQSVQKFNTTIYQYNSLGGMEDTKSYGPFYYNKISTASPYSLLFPYPGSHSYKTDNLVIHSGINDAPPSSQTYNSVLNASNSYKSNIGGSNMNFPTYFSRPTAPFAMPAYDNYIVNGDGIFGKLQPYIFSTSVGTNLYKDPTLYEGMGPKADIIQNRKTQFHFVGSTYNSNSYSMPSNTSTNRINSGYFVKYYTNAEINNSTNLFSNSTYTGFLDYRSVSSGTTRRPAPLYDANAIGGIEITNPSGLTYHYSLPVMVSGTVDKSFELNGDLKINYMPSYAASWKLTAITGSDYKDLNNNKIADIGDIGYWVQYKYGLWSNNFYESNILYGRQNNLSGKISSNHTDLIYRQGFNLHETRSEKYYLDFIRTSTHTAYFIKDIRLDEHSAEFGQKLSQVNPSLKLKRIILMRNQNRSLIENSSSGWNVTGLNSKFNSNLLMSPLDASLIHINKYNVNKTLIDKASLKSLEFVQDYSLCKKYYLNVNSSFGTVSSVDKYYLGSQDQTYFYALNNGSNVLYSSINPSLFNSTDANNSGKLTLNRINSFEDGGIAVYNPQIFDYRKTDVAKNPDYNPLKKDIWGYYKSDHDGDPTNTGYPTCISAPNKDAWSLWKITLPEGGTITMEYESDTYYREGFNDMDLINSPVFGANASRARSALKQPHYIYPIKSAGFSVYPSSVQWENSDKNYIESLLNGASGCTKVDTGSVWVIPILTSCPSPINAGDVSLRDFPEYFIGWNSVPWYSSPNHGRWPNIEDNYCNYPYTNYQNYDKTKYYGYQLQGARWLYGGGLRTKSITFYEPESNTSYKKNFVYRSGYCPAPPTPYILGIAAANTFYNLWNNTFNYIPYLNLTNIGYSTVEIKNEDVFMNSNGITKYYFQNDKFTYNPLTIMPSLSKVRDFGPCNSGYQNILNSNNTNLHIQNYELTYDMNAKLSDAEYKKLGRMVKIEKYADNVSTPVYSKQFNYASYSIEESYDVSQLVNYKKQIPKIVRLTCGTVSTSTCLGVCTDTEVSQFHSSFSSTGSYLVSSQETLDGITTTTNYEYDPLTTQLTSAISTSPTDGKLTTTYEYAYQATSSGGSPLSLKCLNESNLNQLNKLFREREYKSNIGNNSTSNSYLIKETKNANFSIINKIREFNPTTSSMNPGGYYYVNTSSNYVTNLRIPYNSYSGLLNTNTMGNTALTSNDYRSLGEPTLFGKNGKVLEKLGVNNRYNAVKFGYNDLFPLATVNNARYTSFGFTSFEDTITVATHVIHFGGEFTLGSSRKGYNGNVSPHTGSYFSEVPAQSAGPKTTSRLFDTDRTYEAKVWVHKSSPNTARLQMSLKGQTTSQIQINTTISVYKNDPANVQVGDWILMKCKLFVPPNLYIPDPSSTGYNQTPDLIISIDNNSSAQSAFFDDLMFGPIDAPIEGMVYDIRTGLLIASLDRENFASFMNYDAAGRIVSIYKEKKSYGIVKVAENQYNNCQSSNSMNANTNTLNNQ